MIVWKQLLTFLLPVSLDILLLSVKWISLECSVSLALWVIPKLGESRCTLVYRFSLFFLPRQKIRCQTNHCQTYVVFFFNLYPWTWVFQSCFINLTKKDEFESLAGFTTRKKLRRYTWDVNFFFKKSTTRNEINKSNY